MCFRDVPATARTRCREERLRIHDEHRSDLETSPLPRARGSLPAFVAGCLR